MTGETVTDRHGVDRDDVDVRQRSRGGLRVDERRVCGLVLEDRTARPAIERRVGVEPVPMVLADVVRFRSESEFGGRERSS